ncbi:MAG: hypothetical protein ABI468_10495 [Candidatus Nanopelagicales bacterium]
MSKLPRPRTAGRAWTSFVADPPEDPEKPVRGLHEQANPKHRLRVEHDANTLLIHLSGEDGPGWTTLAVDRATRQWAVGQGRRQHDSVTAAYDGLYQR